MQNEQKKLILTNLIDVNFLQKFQDIFAKTMGVASLIVDDKGPITKPSNFTDFCTNHIRASKLGAKKCNECDIEGGKLALEKGEPTIYTCHAGLTHFVVPIIVAGQHIASILGGQIALSKPDEEHFKHIAKELDIKEEKKYLKDLAKIEVVSEKKIKSAVKLLSLVANSISEIAHKNLELIEKNNKEKLIEKIITKVRSTLDEEEIKNFFIEIVSNYFDVDRCLFVDYDVKTKKFLPFRLERLKTNKTKSIIGLDTETEFPEFCKKLKEKKRNIIVKDLEKTLARKNLLGYKALQSLNKSDAKSDYGLIIWYKEQIIGILILHFLDKKRILTHDEFDFLKVLTNNAGTAIYHAKLYKKEQETANRETILRNIIGQIRSSLDIKVIQHEIVNQIGKFFNADSARIADYNYTLEDYVVSGEAEYRASNNVKSMVGIKFKNIQGFNENVRDIHFANNDIIFNDLETYLDEIKIRGTGLEDFYREFKFISSAAININHGTNYLGDFVLTFNHKRDFSEDEINFLKALADQAGVAFSQAKLHLKTVEQKEKETLLRKITETIRRTLDINETKKTIVTEVYKALNADRVYIVNFDPKTKIPQVLDKYSECISPNLKSLIGYDFASPEVEFLSNIYKQNQPVITDNVEKLIKDNRLEGTETEKWLKLTEIKSGIGLPMAYGDKNFGVLCINYTKSIPTITDEYKEFFKAISEQAGIALYQAELHSITKKQAEREVLLRKITSAIRTSLDVKETFDIICSEVAKISDANRVTITEMSKEEELDIVRGEFKSSENIKSAKDILTNRTDVFKYLTNYVFSKNEPLIINDVKETNIPEFVRNFYQSLDVKSITIFPIKKEKDEWGILTISYVHQNKFWNKSEINLIETVLEQIYIAIKQAETYEKTLFMAKRETLIRNITEKIRSSLNIDETLTFICEETAKLFNVQRSAIITFPDKKDYMHFELKKEYKSSSNVAGYVKIPNINKVAEYWGRMLTNVDKIMAIDNIPESDAPDYFKNAYNEMGIKSIIGSIITDGKNNWGDIILSEYNKYRVWTKEEKNLLETISQQIFIAIHQAELYENEKIMLERERMSRNIIEILRSSIDKIIIKKLFVKNIGKFFNADRVFFSEYDSENKKYLPVDKDSEYLSNISEKSFVGYDWSNPDIIEHIQPLLERREVKILDWEEYVQQHPYLNDGLKALYKDSDVKSSYNFPVLYQDKIIGYFCLEFTQKVCKLCDEDIGRIRSICTQAGIALHHAELYLKAQEFLLSKEIIISEFFEKIKKPTNSILETSILMYQNEFERPVQIEYLNNIISSCNQLIELTKDTSNNDDEY